MLVAGPSADAGVLANQQVFTISGAEEIFVVPDDVCQIRVDAYGASGGSGGGNEFADQGGLGALFGQFMGGGNR